MICTETATSLLLLFDPIDDETFRSLSYSAWRRSLLLMRRKLRLNFIWLRR